MQYTKLGNSDLQVSRICMGCMGFGDAQNGQHTWTVDEAHSRAIIKRGLELGVNFFDTAIAYQSGTSEQYLGRAIRDYAKREDVVIATKFLPRTAAEIEAGVTGQRHIEKMLDNETIISSNTQAKDIVEMVEEEYGASKYGSVKYSREEMYWIGYLYRYFSYTYNKSSKQVYKIVKPKELRKLYPAYHTLGVDQAIERILEAKGINPQENELERQYAIFKRIREESPRYK